MIQPTHAIQEFFNDIEDILDREDGRMELVLFKIPLANRGFIESHGSHGAAFYFQGETPEDSSECEYGSTIEQAMVKALERWR